MSSLQSGRSLVFFHKSKIDRAPGELDQLERAAERLLDFPSQVEKLTYVIQYEDEEGYMLTRTLLKEDSSVMTTRRFESMLLVS